MDRVNTFVEREDLMPMFGRGASGVSRLFVVGIRIGRELCG